MKPDNFQPTIYGDDRLVGWTSENDPKGMIDIFPIGYNKLKLCLPVKSRFMTVTRENTEIFDQPHQMWAEGISDENPNETDIQSLLSNEGWTPDQIDIWKDVSQGFYRWYCKISKS